MFRSIRTRIVALFLIAVAVILVAATAFGVLYTRWHEFGISDDNGLSAAKACAAAVEHFGIEELNPESYDYASNRALLRELCSEAGMAYFYVYECDIDNGTIRYLICVAADDHDDDVVEKDRSFGTTIEHELTDAERQALAGNDVYKATEYDNAFGHVLSWTAAVNAGGIPMLAAADYEVSAQRSRVVQGILSSVVPTVMVAIALLAMAIHVLNRSVFGPLRAIRDRMASFSPENAADFKPLGIATCDEMGEIASAFERMAADIGTYIKENEHLTEQRVQTAVELDVARRIQLGIVPARLDIEGLGYQASAVSQAAREVGGDFFDLFELEGGRLAAVVGDASGKGVAAALFMSMAKTMIRDNLSAGKGPAQALNDVNDLICSSNPEGMFLTALALVFDATTGEVRYANAGHMPPILAGGETRAVEVDPGVLLGLFDDADIEEGRLRLQIGEGIVLYTDGATEAVNEKSEFMGEDRIVERLRAVGGSATASSLVGAVAQVVGEFTGGREQFDDLTVLAIARTFIGEVECAVDLASFARLRSAIMSCGVGDALARKACLASEEAFVNVVSYSKASRIWFTVRELADAIVVALSDDGVAFDPLASEPPAKEFEELEEGGMGISLVKQLASELAYERGDGRNTLTIVVK